MTVGINALVQEKGVPVGLLTTAGFRDVLELGRGARREVYNFTYKDAEPLVERYLRREATERLAADGSVVTPLDLKSVDREVDVLLEDGAQAIAVVFLHAYANPAHEAAAKARIEERHPGLSVTASHEITAEWREYERTSTTVLNAFIQPIVEDYLKGLTAELAHRDYDSPVAIMQSNGGVCSAEVAGKKPIRTLMSGPAGGVIGACRLARKLGHANVICADVGGTTYDVALIEEGQILERTDTEVCKRPIVSPLIDITSIGAGGGSVGWIDHRGGLCVGPHSAGADPGPACFGRGGREPTITDAHLLLGRLAADAFLGGRMQLDKEAARAAVEALGVRLNLDTQQSAAGICTIAENNMANAIRTKTIARGLDPRDFAMLSYGGGGGMFAAAVCEELEVGTLLIPPAPANFSAWGILSSDYVEDAMRTRVQPFDHEAVMDITSTLQTLHTQARAAVADYGFAAHDIEDIIKLDLRYTGQEYTITVACDSAWLQDPDQLLKGARGSFVETHRQLYNHGAADAPMEVVTMRCRATGRVTPPPLPKVARSTGEPQAVDSRPIYFTGSGFTETPCLPAMGWDRVTPSRVPPSWTSGPRRLLCPRAGRSPFTPVAH
ncbi:hydantoinase/oxoprolinase family protein [Kineobactrum salinum]|uniref:Hydantoinase/oxoprolinase family protein n=1 Tax=Kineobactrum salinum TaxID=2708301 RepID=A0A6C0U516_9GAMM|nr:hydantoinase/oxoprolinase family protein [Kineobactrum salinum]